MSDLWHDTVFALRTHGGDLSANEVVVRIYGEVGHNYSENEV